MNIKTARQLAGFTQAQAAQITGVPKRSIENWETGQRTPPEYIRQYIVDKLQAERFTARVAITEQSVTVRVREIDGSYIECVSGAITNGTVPLGVLTTIAQLAQNGYRVIYE